MQSDPHYLAICEFYRDRRAQRSQVPYINHIDEGLTVLSAINASLHAKRAYCLHPIFQADADFASAFDDGSVIHRFEIDAYAIALTVEYRSVANAYLSHHKIHDTSEIRLSPSPDVNDMLIADKVQNRRDFLIHHANSHPRAEELAQYFLNWLERLGVNESQYDELSSLIGTAALS